MSPRVCYRVELRVGRTLTRFIWADTPDIAKAIAEHLFNDPGYEDPSDDDEAESIIAIAATATDAEDAS